MDLKCPSFLNIFITSTLYGRKKGSKMLCNGEMDKVQLVSKDCLSVDDNLKTVHEMCWTKSLCSVYNDDSIARNWTGECETTALTRQDELTIQYRCGNISE